MNNKIENHPFEPFLPIGARLIMLGTFPPKPQRWSMPFFYPNKINDMWRIAGLIFFNERNYFWNDVEQKFNLEKIKLFLNERSIALWDTARRVRRLRDNASDKYLEIIEPINLNDILNKRPTIKAVVTTGEKAASVIAGITATDIPKVGNFVECEIADRRFRHYRMPSSSRAYPMALEKKAEFYHKMFFDMGII